MAINLWRPFVRIFVFLLPIIAVLLLWEGTSRHWLANGDPRGPLCPPPSQCAIALVKWAREEGLANDIKASYMRLLGGFVLGTLTGVIVGLLTGRTRFFEAAFVPIINVVRPITPVALIPLFILWFGIEDRAKMITIGFATFFPVWLNTFTGARQIPQRLLWSAGTLTRSPWKIFWRVILPASLPSIVTGMRLGLGIAFTMVFVSELLGTDVGIGYKVDTWQLAYQTDAMIAALVVLGASGAFADLICTGLMFKLFPWLRLVEQGPGKANYHRPTVVAGKVHNRTQEMIKSESGQETIGVPAKAVK
jgi:ABC-type nitrate/sulfonate/bicarbonate transport system permease component